MKRMVRHAFNVAFLVALVGVVASAQTQPVSNSQGSTTPTSSLGDYARQVRKDTAHKPRSFDNDNLPKDDKLSIVGSTDNAGASEESAAPTTEESSSAKSSESTSASDGEAKTESKSAKDGSPSSPEGRPKSAADSATDGEGAPAPTKAEAKSAEEAAAPGATPSSNPDAAAKQAEWKHWGQKINSEKEQIDLAERELNVLQREYQIRAAAMYGDAGNRLRNQTDWDKQDAQYKQQIADKQKAFDDAKQKLDEMQEDARRAGVPANMREPE